MSTTYPTETQFCSGGKVETVYGEPSITGGIMKEDAERATGTLEERLGYLQMTLYKINSILVGSTTERSGVVTSEKVMCGVSDTINSHIETVMRLEKYADEILKRCGEIVELLG